MKTEKTVENMTRYEEFLKAYPKSEECLPRLLRDLRRAIAKDGPHERLAGALEAFDKACNLLGVPFIPPLTSPERSKSIKVGDRVIVRRGASKGSEGTVIYIPESYGPTCDGVSIWSAPLFANVKFREGATMYVRLSNLSLIP